MALFGKKKTEDASDHTEAVQDTAVKDAKKVTPTTSAADMLRAQDVSWVLLSPRMSEKAMLATDRNVYVFNVSPRANKKQISAAIKEIYGVTPKKIGISKIARKNIRSPRTGIRGVKGGGKKAYVYLKDGDTISLV